MADEERKKRGWDRVDVVFLVLMVLCFIAAIICAFTVLPSSMKKYPSESFYKRHSGSCNGCDDSDEYEVVKTFCSVKDLKPVDSVCTHHDQSTEEKDESREKYRRTPPRPKRGSRPSGPRERPSYSRDYDSMDSGEALKRRIDRWREIGRQREEERQREEQKNYDCTIVRVNYIDEDGIEKQALLYENVDQADIVPACTFYICQPNDFAEPNYRKNNLTDGSFIYCYYFSDQADKVYLQKPEPYTWETSAGFHSVFWPALVGGSLLIALIIRKLFIIAKTSAQTAANTANPAVPPTYVPNLYVIGGGESADGMMLGVEKSHTLEEAPQLNNTNPSAPQYFYAIAPPPEYPGLENQAVASTVIEEEEGIEMSAKL